MKRKICVVLTDRANYGRMWPVMREIQNSADLELITVCSGTMMLERFGSAEKIVEADGFSVDGRVYMELEGSIPSTMAKSIGIGVMEFASEFQRLNPDMLLVIGDRYEALAAVTAAAYQNICIAHIQGGEVSGSIDESARHAISKFSHFHFPSTKRSAEYLIMMGESPKNVCMSGCPSGDYILKLDTELSEDLFCSSGVGAGFSPEDDFFLVIFHPVTTEFGQENNQTKEMLNSLNTLKHNTVWLWPNIDAGADHISKELRKFREHNDSDSWLHFSKNFDPVTFQKLLKKAKCAIGNSSSFVRDSTFSGTPVVLVGDRQEGRETAENLIHVNQVSSDEILNAIKYQLDNGRYEKSSLYGDGNASVNIVEFLKSCELYTQKRIDFINR